jgi:hypothetical protein
MNSSHPNRAMPRLALAALLAVAGVTPVVGAATQAADIDPAATATLQRMTNYLGGLQQFSVHTQTDVEDLLDSGQRVDYVVAADLTVSRPDKLRAQRQGEPTNQVFYYDGKQLTLYDRSHQVYATVAAPPTLGAMLGFAQSSLGLVLPAADLLYPNAYPLLMEGITSATVIGKSSIGGISCDHLAFRRPGVDFQVWVADSGPALPYKYIVTDTGTPALLSVSMVMSDWASDLSVSDAEFDFTPPPGTEKIDFMRIDSNTGLGH